MTQRERILTIAVGALVAIIGLLYLANTVTTALDRRADSLMQLDSELARKDRDIQLGNQARRKLRELETKSLPADGQRARGEYEEWLTNLVAKEIQVDKPQVNIQQSLAAGDVYTRHRFLISGYANLEQVVELMYQFHQTDYLHRLSSVSLIPLKGSNMLKISLRAECLSLKNSQNEELPETAPADRLRRDKEAYLQMIAYRNPFAPANKPPQLAELRVQRAIVNKRLSVKIEATDENERDKLTYAIEGDPKAGAKIDPQTGELQLQASEVGEFEMVVKATDNGIPQLSDEMLVKVVVTEPPPEPVAKEAPALDLATQAYLTAITESGPNQRISIHVRTDGRHLELGPGDRVAVGTMEGVVKNIRTFEADIQTDSGETVTVALGEPLVEEDA